ncbi:hypothetical protein AYJ57_17840 [Salipiger sp. CCB-MM3]|uniref:hypothetical protein n=1 Tax=Salipiger sp. CCB-MM3 TaxID=1792508 RepID=UPI00080AB996|nr:hypothetical protein [Salipiger sp. CCB-MM3]ANT62285.1 hypothetical protein AYJ57_17840 [Salipiger sp. CCB-MM3]
MKYFEHLSLEEFWTRTLQEVDHLYARVEQTEEGLSATKRNALLQSLASLRSDGPLAQGSEGHVSRIEALLLDVVDRETLGVRNVFDGHDDPDLGSIGTIRQVPILSEQGCALDGLLQSFLMICAMRALLTARVDAHRQMARLKVV